MKNNILYVVVPCYNEEEVLRETTKKLKVKLQKFIKKKSYLRVFLYLVIEVIKMLY